MGNFNPRSREGSDSNDAQNPLLNFGIISKKILKNTFSRQFSQQKEKFN